MPPAAGASATAWATRSSSGWAGSSPRWRIATGCWRPSAADHGRAAQMPGQVRAVQRRRHAEQAQIRAQGGLDLQAQGQAQIGVERALVELVENHQPVGLQRRVSLQAAGEQALGHHLDPGAGSEAAVEAHGVAHRAAYGLAQEFGHARRRRPRRQPARLQHQDAAVGEPRLVQEAQRHQRGLARTRRSLEHGGGARGERRTQLVGHVLDGQIGQRRLGIGGHGPGIATASSRAKASGSS